MIQIHKLAGLDMALHGARLIMGEFAVGVALPAGLGILCLRATAAWQYWLGWYLIGIAINYLPLLIWAIRLRSRERASVLVKPELADRTMMRRYSAAGSLLLLLPLAVALLAVLQAGKARERL